MIGDILRTVTLKGLKITVTRGRKGPEDERVYIKSLGKGKGTPLETAHLVWLVSHYYQVEEKLYPTSGGCMGGEMLLACIRQACETGEWEQALEDHGIRAPRGTILKWGPSYV